MPATVQEFVLDFNDFSPKFVSTLLETSPGSATWLDPSHLQNSTSDKRTRAIISFNILAFVGPYLAHRDHSFHSAQFEIRSTSMHFYSLWATTTLVALLLGSSHAFSPLRTPLRARGSSSCRSTQKMFVSDMLSITDALSHSISQPATSLLVAEGEVCTFDVLEQNNDGR